MCHLQHWNGTFSTENRTRVCLNSVPDSYLQPSFSPWPRSSHCSSLWKFRSYPSQCEAQNLVVQPHRLHSLPRWHQLQLVHQSRGTVRRQRYCPRSDYEMGGSNYDVVPQGKSWSGKNITPSTPNPFFRAVTLCIGWFKILCQMGMLLKLAALKWRLK